MAFLKQRSERPGGNAGTHQHLLPIPPVQPVKPVHIHTGRDQAESNKERWHIPLPRQVPDHGREDEPEADCDKEHAGYDFWIDEGDIDLLDIHSAQPWC